MTPTVAPAKKSKSKKPRPALVRQYCKGCGRCIESCPKHCISLGDEIDPSSGYTPVLLDLDECTACGLCFGACPEPYGLVPTPARREGDFELEDPEALFGPRTTTAPRPIPVPDTRVAMPALEPMVLKGNYAAAVGAMLAGCRHFFGYPITPSSEGAELMAKLLPEMNGVFLQAVSEVATVNMMYGCGGAGLRSMTFTSSPGFSLMLEGISYMIGAGNQKSERFGEGFPSHLAASDVEVKFAGSGGDGAQTLALLTCRAAINEGFDSTYIPSYGPESRGGTSYADIHIADGEVLSPAAPTPHVLVAFNAPSLQKFGPTVKPGGLIVYDSSVIRDEPKLDPSIRVNGAPFTEIALELG